MARPRYIQAQKFTLSGSGVTSSATSITLTSMKLPDGATNIVTADLGDTATYPTYMTLEPGTSKEELISFTGITQNVGGTATLTGVTRGLRFVNPHDEVSANKLAHAGGSIAILSNASILYQKLIDYMDTIAVAGSTDASTTVKGLVEVSTTAQFVAGTALGETGAPLVITPDNTGFISTSAGAGDVGKVPRLNADGKLDKTFLGNVQIFTADGTWTKPANINIVEVVCIGGGGSGGGGEGVAAGNTRRWGTGGGGGSIVRKIFRASDLGSTETVTVSGAVAGGAGGTNNSGTDGTVGGNSSFGTFVVAYGGGAGDGATGSDRCGGAGGGSAGAGPNGTTSSVNGGAPASSTGNGISGQGAGAVVDAAGNSAEFGGGSGGGGGPSLTAATVRNGGSSLFGAGGGGSGGGVNNGSPGTEVAGAVGGAHGSYTAGGGGSAGATNGGTGGAGTSRSGYGCGDGGGGGGGNNDGTGGTGGAGGAPGGGGGGGSGGTNTGGTGGAGGRGEVRVFCY